MRKEKTYRLYDIFLYEDEKYQFHPVTRSREFPNHIVSLEDGSSVFWDDHPGQCEGPFTEYTQILGERGIDSYDISTFMFFAKALNERGIDIFSLQNILDNNITSTGTYQHPLLERYRSILEKNSKEVDKFKRMGNISTFLHFTRATDKELITFVSELNSIVQRNKMSSLEIIDEQLPF